MKRSAIAQARVDTESKEVRYILTALALAFMFLFLGLPLLAVFTEAFRQGVGPYWTSLVDPDTRHAIMLTVLIAVVVLPFNILFGLATAWAIARFEFRRQRACC